MAAAGWGLKRLPKRNYSHMVLSFVDELHSVLGNSRDVLLARLQILKFVVELFLFFLQGCLVGNLAGVFQDFRALFFSEHLA